MSIYSLITLSHCNHTSRTKTIKLLRAVLGKDAMNRVKAWQKLRSKEAEEWREVTESTVFEGAVEVPHLQQS